jgi:hypothetical protein
MKRTVIHKKLVVLAFALWIGLTTALRASPPEGRLHIGWASRDITPDQPVALAGQMHTRIANEVLDPLTCTALAIETRDGADVIDQAILISCDLLAIREGIQNRVQETLKGRLPEFEARKLFMNATHTHTAPVMREKNRYDIPQEGVMQPVAYVEFLVERVVEAAVAAWKGRKPAGMSWGLGHAVVGHNRRLRYFDGSAVMYGSPRQPDFSHVEGYEDASVEMLFFWDQDSSLTGILIHLACPAQETEGLSKISSDFWHEARLELRKRYGKNLYLLPQCGAAGDQSPHILLHKQGEELMLKRKGISSRQEIALRIADAVDKVFPYVRERKYIRDRVIFRHLVNPLDLPAHEEGNSNCRIELHVLRLGDVAMATNPFEMYLDYGLRIKGRSEAVMTLAVQLACDSCGYLPSARAIAGGGYSAVDFRIGPGGGQLLVDETVKRINSMWE